MKTEVFQIPRSTYDHLVQHLEIHASTDAWAAAVLQELEKEAKPVRLGVTPKGAWIVDGQSTVEYRCN